MTTKSHNKKLTTAWIRGWDDCLTGRQCQYYRRDFINYWQSGFEACKRGDKFPVHMQSDPMSREIAKLPTVQARRIYS